MATNRKKNGVGSVDIFDLPVIRGVKRQYSRLLFANHAVRREAKSLLFNELHMATTLGMPMEEALQRVGQTHGEARLTLEKMIRHGADNRNPIRKLLFTILLILTSYISMIAYFFSSFRMADTESVSRRLARRLVRFVERGRNLSEAMEASMPDFTYEEVMMVRAGENWGKVSEALHHVSRINSPVGQLAIHKSHVGYPLFVLVVVLNLLFFFQAFIAPKMQDIASQLSIPINMGLFGSDPTRLDGIMLLAFTFASLMLPFLILRTLMNGTTEMKAIVSLLLLFSGVAVIISSSIEFLNYFPNNGAYVLPAAGAVALIYIFYIPAIMGGMEWVINQLERVIKWILSKTPIMGRSEKLRRESVWITTLSLALKSGVSSHEAVDFASRVSRLISRKRSAKIISMAESGHPIGYSCLKSRGLPGRLGSKLVLYDGRENYVDSLGYLAEEITYENFERQGRIEALFEVTALVAIGLVVFFAAWGIYSFFNSIATMKL